MPLMESCLLDRFFPNDHENNNICELSVWWLMAPDVQVDSEALNVLDSIPSQFEAMAEEIGLMWGSSAWADGDVV